MQQPDRNDVVSCEELIRALEVNPSENWAEMLLKANSLEDEGVLDDFEKDFDKTEW